MAVHLLTTIFIENFKSTVGNYCSEKNILFKILLLTDNVPGHSRAVMEMDKETNIIFMSPNTAPIL